MTPREELHSVLRRQLRKNGLAIGTPPDSQDAWERFLGQVSQHYLQSEQGHYLLERSIELSAREMRELNRVLSEANAQLRQNQSQMVQSEKMAGLGQLAAGIAHEINNPVGFVLSNLRALEQYLEVFAALFGLYEKAAHALQVGEMTEARSRLSEAAALRMGEDFDYLIRDAVSLVKESQDGALRMKDIVQNLRSFARTDDGECRETDIIEGLESTLKIVWNEIKFKCRVEKHFSPIPRIMGYPGQLNQVFMNLLMNAAQAIEEEGVITLTTKVSDEKVMVSISDTGSGIAPENLGSLFTPFFTTKPVGKGTGLGLSISYDIIRRHQGSIEVQSALGEGTTFTLRFPTSLQPTGS